MKQQFLFTPQAQADVLAIWQYIADQDSEKAADRVIARIYRDCKKLADHPTTCHYREELLDKRHRFWRTWSYLIIYRWQPKPIQVIAIVHGARDLDLFLNDRTE